MSENTVRIEFQIGGGSIALTREMDGGLTIEQEIVAVDGKRDHLRVRNNIRPVDAQRVFELFAEPRQ